MRESDGQREGMATRGTRMLSVTGIREAGSDRQRERGRRSPRRGRCAVLPCCPKPSDRSPKTTNSLINQNCLKNVAPSQHSAVACSIAGRWRQPTRSTTRMIPRLAWPSSWPPRRPPNRVSTHEPTTPGAWRWPRCSFRLMAISLSKGKKYYTILRKKVANRWKKSGVAD